MACINIDATCELQLCSMMICSSTTPPTLQPLLFRSRRSAQHGQFPWPVADRCYSLPVYGVCCVSAGFTTQRANDVEPFFTETNLIGSDLCLSLDAPLIYDQDRCADLCILPGFGVVGEGTMSSWWLCFVCDGWSMAEKFCASSRACVAIFFAHEAARKTFYLGV